MERGRCDHVMPPRSGLEVRMSGLAREHTRAISLVPAAAAPHFGFLTVVEALSGAAKAPSRTLETPSRTLEAPSKSLKTSSTTPEASLGTVEALLRTLETPLVAVEVPSEDSDGAWVKENVAALRPGTGGRRGPRRARGNSGGGLEPRRRHAVDERTPPLQGSGRGRLFLLYLARGWSGGRFRLPVCGGASGLRRGACGRARIARAGLDSRIGPADNPAPSPEGPTPTTERTGWSDGRARGPEACSVRPEVVRRLPGHGGAGRHGRTRSRRPGAERRSERSI